MHLQSLSEIFDEHVSNDPDVVTVREQVNAELDRLGLAAISPIVSKYVGVCFEEWNESFHVPLFADIPPHTYRQDERLSVAWRTLIEATKAAITRLICKFRLGLLRAVASDLQHGNGFSKPVPASWWRRFDGFVSIDENRLAEGHGLERADIVTEVKVEHYLPEERVRPDSSLSQAVELMVDPEIHNEPPTVRGNPIGFPVILDIEAESPFLRRRRRISTSQLQRLRNELRTYLRDCFVRGTLDLRCFHSLTAEPERLPADRIELVDFDFRKSTVALPGQPPILARVFPGRSAATRRPGRPSRRHEILSAYEHLTTNNVVSFEKPVATAIEQVRVEVKRRSHSNSEKGLGNEAIRKVIGPRFESEKDRIGQRP